MVQYRGQLMPLVRVSDDVSVKREGAQPLLVFSDGGRSMGLVVDEIVDIVEDSLDIEVGSDRPGVLGSAVIKGQATEIIDVGHFLPLAFEDWFRRKDARSRPAPAHGAAGRRLRRSSATCFRRCCKAAGYDVTAVASGARGAVDCSRRAAVSMSLVTDIEMPEMDGFALAEAVRGEPRTAEMPIIALSSYSSPESIERGRQVGFHDYVAKFDRQSLIAALKEQTAECSRAA